MGGQNDVRVATTDQNVEKFRLTCTDSLAFRFRLFETAPSQVLRSSTVKNLTILIYCREVKSAEVRQVRFQNGVEINEAGLKDRSFERE